MTPAEKRIPVDCVVQQFCVVVNQHSQGELPLCHNHAFFVIQLQVTLMRFQRWRRRMSSSEQLFELLCHCRWNVSSSQDVSRHNGIIVPPFKIHTCRNCSMAWIFSSTTYHTTASVTPVTMPKTQNNYPCAECWNWTKLALTLKTGLKVREGHWKCHHSIDSLWPSVILVMTFYAQREA